MSNKKRERTATQLYTFAQVQDLTQANSFVAPDDSSDEEACAAIPLTNPITTPNKNPAVALSLNAQMRAVRAAPKIARNRVLVLAACLIGVVFVAQSVGGSSDASGQGKMLKIADLDSTMRSGGLNPVGRRSEYGDLAVRAVNPTIYPHEKLFCQGFQTSKFCTERPLHPYLETLSRFGVPYVPPKKRVALRNQWKFENLGWKIKSKANVDL